MSIVSVLLARLRDMVGKWGETSKEKEKKNIVKHILLNYISIKLIILILNYISSIKLY